MRALPDTKYTPTQQHAHHTPYTLYVGLCTMKKDTSFKIFFTDNCRVFDRLDVLRCCQSERQ